MPLKFAAKLSLRDGVDHQWDKPVVHFQYFVSCRAVSAPLFVTKDLTTDDVLEDTAQDFTVFVLCRGARYTARWGTVNSLVRRRTVEYVIRVGEMSNRGNST